jgi:hypothetical protein
MLNVGPAKKVGVMRGGGAQNSLLTNGRCGTFVVDESVFTGVLA